MKSRVHPKYKTKYRVGNWADYDRALVQRGDITLWISAEAIESWTPAPSGRRGGQRKFSDVAIEAFRIAVFFVLRVLVDVVKTENHFIIKASVYMGFCHLLMLRGSRFLFLSGSRKSR